jgi:predicted ArsR family transcriptional regulator
MNEALKAHGSEHDTVRLLVHLFTAEAREDREVKAMAKRFAMAGNIVRYHLDQLKQAGLADVESVCSGVYWAPTSAGRKYVVERKLI